MTSPSSPTVSCASIRSSRAARRRSSSRAASDRSDARSRGPEGGAAPQIERVVERTDGRLRIDRQESPRVAKEGLEASGIELRWLGPQDVARPAPLDAARLRGPCAGERRSSGGRSERSRAAPHPTPRRSGRRSVRGGWREGAGGQGPPAASAPRARSGRCRSRRPRSSPGPGIPSGDGSPWSSRWEWRVPPLCVRSRQQRRRVAESSLKGSGQRVTRLPHRALMQPGSTVRPCARSVGSELRSSL